MNWKLIGYIWTAVELLTAATSWGGGYCRPSYSCYQQSYYKPYYPPVQVVNNLIGIPVPVAYKANIAEQGRTLYSYQSYNFAKPFDFTLAFTQAGRLVEQSQALAQQGQEGMQQSMQLAIEGSSRIAEINAKRDAAVATLKAAEATGEALRLRLQTQATHQQTEVLPPQPGGGESPYPAPLPGGNGGTAPPPPADGDIVRLLQTKCLTCHNGTRVKKDEGVVETEHGIDLSKYVALRPELKAIVLERIDSDDPDMRMPPSGRLTWKEKAVFFQN